LANHHLLGTEGEALAVKWLTEKGFSMLHVNWRYSYYEIDIIASLKDVLHFIEVKTRTNKKFGEPEARVDQKKIINLLKAGAAYHYQHPAWKRIQYDVLSVSIQPGNMVDYFFIEDIYAGF